MSREILFRSLGKRNWAREGGKADTSISGTGFKKSVLGAMVLGTLASLAIISSALWAPKPKKRYEPGRQRIYLVPKGPNKRIIWPRI
jgi:hypothetical protein